MNQPHVPISVNQSTPQATPNQVFNALIDFAIEHCGIEVDVFLKNWREGAFEELKRDWPECPAIVFAQPRHESFQERVQPWMLECFGAEIAADTAERNHRFFEEASELVQANGMSRSEAHQLVDYVFDRPVGEFNQEVGGVQVTLAALCLSRDSDMHAAGEVELARIWTKVDQIRAKQAAKPKHSPLPAAPAANLKGLSQRAANFAKAMRATDWAAPSIGRNMLLRGALEVLDEIVASHGVDQVLDKPAQVGGTVFQEGIRTTLVIKAAQRNYAWRNDPETPRPYPDRFGAADIESFGKIISQADRRFVDLRDFEALQREVADFADEPVLDPGMGSQHDPLYETAVTVVRGAKRASVSLLQRHLRIGYNRASLLLESMVGTVLTGIGPNAKILPVADLNANGDTQ